MRAVRTISLFVAFLAAASVTSATTISSTATGGPWSQNATWLGGVVPGTTDDVVIAGPVEIAGTAACQSLTVNASGQLGSALAGPNNTLQVSGAVTNAGTISGGTFPFWLEVGGDLHNDGVWANAETIVTGTADRYLSHGTDARFATDFSFSPDASGDLIATTPLEVTGDVDLFGGRLVLQADCPFSLDSGVFKGELSAGGNEMRFISWSYLQQCTVDDVVLVGEVEADFSVVFTTRVTVQGVLQNASGGGGVTIQGDLINNGVIRNVQYSFFVNLTGDLENNGAITCPTVSFQGDEVHHLSMSPDAILDTNIFLPEFTARTLVADTPVRFADGLHLGTGELILEPGSSLTFEGLGGLGSGHVMANGNEISTTGTGGVGNVTIDRGVIAGQVAMSGDVLFTNGMTVTGVVTSWPWAGGNLTVEGLLRNEGEVRDGDHPVTITALNDVLNLGTFANSQIILAGSVDQFVGAGPGISAAAFVMESGLQAASYQWYRDNIPLPGETAPNLTWATVGAAEYGAYHCAGDGADSRTITIAKTLPTSDVPGAAFGAVLAQNQPNPFNPATNIAFSLARAGQVSLVVYDLAGRRVADLVRGELAAGPHDVLWQPQDLPSGIYLYRLRANGVDRSRKCLLVK